MSATELTLPKTLSTFAHAYILESVDQVSASNTLEQLAQILLCQNTGGLLQEPCQTCHSCSLFAANNHPDFFDNDTEQNSIGVDEVRQISEFLTKTAQLSGNQVVLLHDVEKMTENASNALLKTLEEPTAKSYLLLSCQNKLQLLPTLLSRCQFLALPAKSKDELQQIYSGIPDYLIGFSKGAESKLEAWQQNQDSLVVFADIYQNFIAWLKRQIPDFVLVGATASDPEQIDFLLYLFSRRLYQLGIKQNSNVSQAQALLNKYQNTTRKAQGVNQSLAITDLVAELRRLI